MDQARCRDVDPNMFFPDTGELSGPALAICRTCPVVDACLGYALDCPEPLTGIWGATTQRQRTRIRKTGKRSKRTLAKPAGAAGANAVKTHCKRGHEFDESNTRYYRGKRTCRACAQQRSHAKRFERARRRKVTA
jgi:WhiB family redox-sensing transcriptional regulator